MRTYHVIKNGVPMEISNEELQRINESNESVELDIQWYLNNGATRFCDFMKTHPIIDGNNK